MMYHGTQKQEIAGVGGVRRVEFRYSGDIDESGTFKLKRRVGKSFFDKGDQVNTTQSADVGTARRHPGVRPDKTS